MTTSLKIKGYTIALTLNGRFDDALNSVKNVNDKAKVLSLIYFKQNNKTKLDSILKTIDQTKLTNSEKSDYFALRNDKENFFRVMNSEKMNSDIIVNLRGEPGYELMRSDPRYAKLLEPYTFKELSFSLD